MASYDELDSLTGKLKRAAIDAYMTEYSNGWWELDGDHYQVKGGDATVTRPGEDGSGGGDWDGHFPLTDWMVNGDKDKEFKVYFDDIRSRIDTALADWQPSNIPDPDLIFPDSDNSAHDAIGQLSSTESDDYSTSIPAGPLGDYVNDLKIHCDGLTGVSMDAFYKSYCGALPRTISNHRGIAIVLAQARSAEKETWKRGRQAVADIIHQTTTELNKSAKGGTAALSMGLGILGAVLAGATAVVSGGATMPLSLSSAGVSLLTSVTSNAKSLAEEVDEGKDYESCMTAFEGLLKAASGDIKIEETLVRDKLNENFTSMASHKSSYDLTMAVSDNGNESWDDDKNLLGLTDSSQVVINLTDPELNTMIDSDMPHVKNALNAAAWKLWEAGLLSNELYRGGGLGLGTYGPATEARDLADRASDTLLNLAWEVENGRAMLKALMNDMRATDGSGQAALTNLQKSLTGGEPWSAWT